MSIEIYGMRSLLDLGSGWTCFSLLVEYLMEGSDREAYGRAKEELFLDQLVGTTDAPQVAVLLPLGRHYCCPF